MIVFDVFIVNFFRNFDFSLFFLYLIKIGKIIIFKVKIMDFFNFFN